MVLSPLVRDENGVWRMDYEDMERKIKENRIHAAVFCTPHNPTGRVWERWEIERAMELFQKYDVFVISDEIWSDLILMATSIFQHSLCLKMQKTVPLHYMHHLRHSTLPV